MVDVAHATVEDYTRLFGAPTDTELLAGKLDACTIVIDVELDARGKSVDDVNPSVLSLVCCQMANRLMPSAASDIPFGATSMSETVGQYSHSYSFGTTYGSPKLNAAELDLLLGRTASRIGWAGVGSNA